MSMMPWDGVFKLIDDAVTRIWPDKTEEQKNQLTIALQEVQLEYDNATQQLSVNNTEASNDNVFVSGWRPYIGWICGSAYAYKFILYPFIMFMMAANHATLDPSLIPVIDTSELSNVLYGMLGLGTLRTVDKAVPHLMDTIKSVKNKK